MGFNKKKKLEIIVAFILTSTSLPQWLKTGAFLTNIFPFD
jgi:hypothetical protein